MKTRKTDISKIKQVLSIKSIADSVPVIGGGIALLCMDYLFWGIICVLAGSFGVFSKLIENKVPKLGRVISNTELSLEIVALITGGITLILLGQIVGGIACICVCIVKTAMDVFFLPLVEKKYLTAH
jgi:polyferredoxin